MVYTKCAELGRSVGTLANEKIGHRKRLAPTRPDHAKGTRATPEKAKTWGHVLPISSPQINGARLFFELEPSSCGFKEAPRREKPPHFRGALPKKDATTIHPAVRSHGRDVARPRRSGLLRRAEAPWANLQPAPFWHLPLASNSRNSNRLAP